MIALRFVADWRMVRAVSEDGPGTVITRSSRLIYKGKQPLIAREPRIVKQRRSFRKKMAAKNVSAGLPKEK